ncbi:MAG: GNAT family N-acetyltransferase [Balneola sp.]|nr:GNAT family N-acetyltransferase [Balneola sp.]MBO6650946.1 GNAT family N-acetyltransferase [Balneola sp.]MBO6800083.1 GNAT family N-acetyltransferase [Balneola sp.]
MVALAPLYENRIKLFNGNWYRKLEFIGNRVPDSKGLFYDYSPTDYLDFIIDKSFKSKVVSKLTDWLIGKLLEYDEVLLDELPADGVFYENLLPELEKKDVNIKQIRKEICYQIDLKGIDTIDDYLSSLSRKQRYELRYSKKAVLKKKLFEIEKARNEEQVIDFFNELVSMHQERWNKLGYPGIFYDSRVYNFLRDITLACHKRGSLRFKRAVEKENNSLALDLAFSFNDVIYDYQKALDSDHKLAKYGPGNALLYFLIEDGINTGYSKIDLMRGGERYKRRVSNSSSYNWEVSLKSATKCNKKGQKIYELQNQLDQILRKGKRELSLLNIQIMQNGWIKSIPSYYSFLKKRLQNS